MSPSSSSSGEADAASPEAGFSTVRSGLRCRRRRSGSASLSRQADGHRPQADNHPEKWVYSQHAAAKHEILRRYLGAWLPILGSRHPKLVIYDGFAGRGRYRDGEDGSPVLMFKRASEAVDAGRAQQVSIRCVEFDHDNYDHLQAVIGELNHQGVTIDARNDRFDVVANELADHEQVVRRRRERVPPIFFFADPFGFSGI